MCAHTGWTPAHLAGSQVITGAGDQQQPVSRGLWEHPGLAWQVTAPLHSPHSPHCSLVHQLLAEPVAPTLQYVLHAALEEPLTARSSLQTAQRPWQPRARRFRCCGWCRPRRQEATCSRRCCRVWPWQTSRRVSAERPCLCTRTERPGRPAPAGWHQGRCGPQALLLVCRQLRAALTAPGLVPQAAWWAAGARACRCELASVRNSAELRVPCRSQKQRPGPVAPPAPRCRRAAGAGRARAAAPGRHGRA